jgi:Zn-dependent protease
MTWDERPEEQDDPWRKLGRPGGDWQGLRPSFDNPVTWSIPVGRVAGIDVRLHAIFLLFIAVELVRESLEATTTTFIPLCVVLGGLVLIVFLHELGHCLACRWVGGQAMEILMWPLGGLAFTLPPHHWRAHLITVLGGPMVNVVFLLVTAPLLWMATGVLWGVAIPTPLDLSGLYEADVAKSWLLQALFALNWVNLVLLLFNLLPMFPMDGGRILQAVLWRWIGYSRSMRIAVRVGYIGAILLGVAGLVMRDGWLIGIAIFGGITCYITHRQLQWTDEMMGFEGDEYALSLQYGRPEESGDEPRSPTRAEKTAERRAQQLREEAAEVDRVLAKIRDHGLTSLSRAEQGRLKRATERTRNES